MRLSKIAPNSMNRFEADKNEHPLIVMLRYVPIAQQVEHLTFNQVVLGSNPNRHTSRFIIGIRSLLMLVGYAIQGYANHPIVEDA